MAEGKKSFIAYCDWGEIFDELEDKEAGKLAKHLFDYVRDRDPKTDDKLIKILFIQIQQSLKRDLKKYEGIKEKRSAAGKESARLRAEQKAANPTSVESVQQTSTNPTVSVNDSVTVNGNVNDTDNVIESVINKNTHPALIAFRNNVFKEANEQGIKNEVAEEFYLYWSAMHYESGKFLFQYTENFTLHNKLKGWQKIEEKNNSTVKKVDPKTIVL